MDLITLGNKVLTFSLYKKDVIIGIGSRVGKSNNHVLHLDLDNFDEQTSINIIKIIQKKHSLGTALLLESSFQNYHAIFFNPLMFDYMIRIQKSVNLKHGCMSELKGESTIRLSSKFGDYVKLVKIINAKSFRDMSQYHYNVFIKHFGINPRNFKFKHFVKNTDEGDLYSYEKRLKIW